MPELVTKFRSKAALVFQGTNWINQAITEDCLNRVIGAMFTPHRMLVWDHFKCHVGKNTKDSLKKLKIGQVVIPGGCTGVVALVSPMHQMSVGINPLKTATQKIIR